MPAAADVTIRIASLEDVQALAGAHVASWRETYAGMMPDELLASLSVDARAAMWTKILDEPLTPASTVVYVAELENRIAGFGSCGAQRTEALKQRSYDGEIIAIYVLKAFQRHAIGRQLLSALASHLSQSGFAAASLWVLRDNTPARQFYERYGAQVIAALLRGVSGACKELLSTACAMDGDPNAYRTIFAPHRHETFGRFKYRSTVQMKRP